MTRRRIFLIAVWVSLVATVPTSAGDGWPGRVLLTNDNGIDDTKIIELARALADRTEVYVVASTVDRSGTTNLLSSVKTRQFVVEERDLGDGIVAYALDGYPADCVLFALAGPMRESPPDLVISGINGGPNLGDDWFGSGTIGAARTAAYMGLPAVAVSGLDDDDPAAVRAAVDWVVKLAFSPAVRNLRPPQYLTVSLPRSEVRGLDVVPRARGLLSGIARPTDGPRPSGKTQTWALELSYHPELAPEDSDVGAASRNRIAIVPMRVDEYDPALREALQRDASALPEWTAPVREPSECTAGFGAMISDAEDDSEREWGVLIEEILAGGKAEVMGLQAGDVIVTLDGQDLSLEPAGRRGEDPVEQFVRLLGDVRCDQTLTLEYVRQGARHEARFTVTPRDEVSQGPGGA